MLVEKSVHDFIEIVDSNEPVPGGGSVSALAGSIAAALGRMVGSLTFNKKAFKEYDESIQNCLRESSEKLLSLKEELEKGVDKDANAFDKVMEAFAMPKETEEEKKLRSEKVQEGYKIALETPRRAAKACMEVLDLLEPFVKYGTKGAVSDVGVGVLMATSGVEGSIFNVKINLLAMKDEKYIEEANKEADEIIEKMNKKRDELLKIVYERLK
ncbi:cyclodeaminase/cyclohydrolase family protein [Citroniella saccharovorans]|uniref:Cyclodeaminase/cyclohydrolase family protein n=1 Tax=Citroniella saccharovorans TaxID=2053367 RepID=A0AAW9MYB1_9FIRM|nr:cyclodeaminase/cyclohydrolase family protein [Citroniella saccharovorans]MEB3429027.1 cyclodeaminase/cyclohydrolase family protein [Citroniella saccharovorans]